MRERLKKRGAFYLSIQRVIIADLFETLDSIQKKRSIPVFLFLCGTDESRHFIPINDRNIELPKQFLVAAPEIIFQTFRKSGFYGVEKNVPGSAEKVCVLITEFAFEAVLKQRSHAMIHFIEVHRVAGC